MPIAYERTGRGPAVVLLHPLGADRRVWDPIVRRLRDDRELIAVDLPGFGQSHALSLTPTPSALAQAVVELLATIGVERPHVAGISLGGWVALELGLRGDVESTTAIAPAGLWSAPLDPKRATPHAVARTLAPLIPLLIATPTGRRLWLSGIAAHPERIPAADAVHLARAWALAPGFEAVTTAMRADRFTGLERIPGPVTLVWPEHDKLVRRPRTLPSNVVNVELADAGHVPVWDAPDELATILREATSRADVSASA